MQHEIGANVDLTTMPVAPRKLRRAKSTEIAKNSLPSAALTPSGGQRLHDNHVLIAAGEPGAKFCPTTGRTLPLARLIDELQGQQKTRVFAIKSQSRCDRSCEAFIARQLGYHTDLDEKGRKALFAQAAKIRREVEKGGHHARDNPGEDAPLADGDGHSTGEHHVQHAISVCTPIIIASAKARSAWDDIRGNAQKAMRKAVAHLPAATFADGIAGLGALGLGIIVGEAGDIGTYVTQYKVWKRLGLAVIEGERQQKKTNVTDAAAHGYNPRRRAEIWTIADSMFKHQWCGDKDEDGKDPAKTKKPIAVAAHPTGPYGEVYAKRKAHTETRGWTPAHRDADARRVMTKALIEDLWRAWRVAVSNGWGQTSPGNQHPTAPSVDPIN